MSENREHPPPRIGSIVIHCHAFDRMVAFWGEALGYEPRGPGSGDWMVLRDPARRGPNLSFQRRETRAARRSWIHLDLYTDDREREVERLVGLGARRYEWRYPPGADYVVLEDPDGNLFCVVRHVDLQPTLRGELVRLRPLRAGDFEELYAAASDPLIWDQHPVQRHEPEVFRSYFRESLESGGALVILDRESGRIIGSSRYHGYDPSRREVEIGWSFLERAYWGGRYNGEVKRLMLEHAFRFVDRVLFLVAPGNLRSRRALEKIGGIRAGSRSNAYGLESCVYEIVKPDLRTEPDPCTD